MPQPFFDRLATYYEKIAEVLRGSAESASVFPNPSDRGGARERIYIDFLRAHTPAKCTVSLGGFLFDSTGAESSQIDALVYTDTVARFDFLNQDGTGKAFSHVDGTLAVAAVKSTLDKKELFDALSGFESIPPSTPPIVTSLALQMSDTSDWPLKIIYASDGISGEALTQHIYSFYAENSQIPTCRRVNLIHVAGKYLLMRTRPGDKVLYDHDAPLVESQPDDFRLFKRRPDVQALMLVSHEIQRMAIQASLMVFSPSNDFYTNFFRHLAKVG